MNDEVRGGAPLCRPCAVGPIEVGRLETVRDEWVPRYPEPRGDPSGQEREDDGERVRVDVVGRQAQWNGDVEGVHDDIGQWRFGPQPGGVKRAPAPARRAATSSAGDVAAAVSRAHRSANRSKLPRWRTKPSTSSGILTENAIVVWATTSRIRQPFANDGSSSCSGVSVSTMRASRRRSASISAKVDSLDIGALQPLGGLAGDNHALVRNTNEVDLARGLSSSHRSDRNVERPPAVAASTRPPDVTLRTIYRCRHGGVLASIRTTLTALVAPKPALACPKAPGVAGSRVFASYRVPSADAPACELCVLVRRWTGLTLRLRPESDPTMRSAKGVPLPASFVKRSTLVVVLSGRPTLTLFCGLPGSGKTTVAKRIEAESAAVRICTDDWQELLGVPHSDEGFHDRLQIALYAHALRLLSAGVDVILEDGLWTKPEREQKLADANKLNVRTHLHYFDLSLDVIRTRIEHRNAALPRAPWQSASPT